MTITQYDEDHVGEILAGQGDWFSAQLLRLIAKADRENKALIRQVYPDHVAAYERFMLGEVGK